MPRQTWIADKLRYYGLDVIEQPGWKTRGSTSFNPRGVVVHHTASARGSDTPSLGIVVHGRTGLPGPLCHVLIARSGTCHVIAAGRANHAGTGSYRGLVGNTSVLGIEAENDGLGEPWPPHQLGVFEQATAALLDGINRGASWVCGHKEWTPRKIDPTGIRMDDFRLTVSRLLGAPPMPTTPGLVEQWQRALIANGAKLGDSGPNQNGIDDQFGRLTLAESVRIIDGRNADIRALTARINEQKQAIGHLTGLLDDGIDDPELLRDAELGRRWRDLANATLATR